jgi:hypothetical protein
MPFVFVRPDYICAQRRRPPEAWARLKLLCPTQHNVGMALIRKQKNGFGKDKGVLYKIMDAIDVEEEQLYLVPSTSRPGVAGSGVSEYSRGGADLAAATATVTTGGARVGFCREEEEKEELEERRRVDDPRSTEQNEHRLNKPWRLPS